MLDQYPTIFCTIYILGENGIFFIWFSIERYCEGICWLSWLVTIEMIYMYCTWKNIVIYSIQACEESAPLIYIFITAGQRISIFCFNDP